MSQTDQQELKRIWHKANKLERVNKAKAEAIRAEYWNRYRYLRSLYLNQ